MVKKAQFTEEQVAKAAKNVGYRGDLKLFASYMAVEAEHTDVTKGSPTLTARIVMAHLRESPRYYAGLKKMEKSLGIKD